MGAASIKFIAELVRFLCSLFARFELITNNNNKTGIEQLSHSLNVPGGGLKRRKLAMPHRRNPNFEFHQMGQVQNLTFIKILILIPILTIPI